MSNLSRLELTLGTEFNECSIASAELAQRVETMFDDVDFVMQRQLIIMDGLENDPRMLDVVPVSDTFITPAGREVQLLLTRSQNYPDSQAQMVAVTRGDVAFPLVAFTRRPGSQCDYVQIGPEMSDDTLVVTPGDEHSRQDIIESMRQFLAVDPLQYTYGDVIKEAVGDTSTKQLELEAGFNKHLNNKHKYNRRIKHTENEIILLAVLVSCIQWSFDPNQLTHRGKQQYQFIQKELSKFFERPNFHDIVSGKVPGSDNEHARRVLIRKVAKQKFGDRMLMDNSQMGTDNLATLFGLDDQINSYLGPPLESTERIFSLTAQLAGTGELTADEENMLISKTHGDVEIFVNVQPAERTAQNVSVRANPKAMADQLPVEIYNLTVDRTAELTIADAEAEELAYILGKVTLKALASTTSPDRDLSLFDRLPVGYT